LPTGGGIGGEAISGLRFDSLIVSWELGGSRDRREVESGGGRNTSYAGSPTQEKTAREELLTTNLLGRSGLSGCFRGRQGKRPFRKTSSRKEKGGTCSVTGGFFTSNARIEENGGTQDKIEARVVARTHMERWVTPHKATK